MLCQRHDSRQTAELAGMASGEGMRRRLNVNPAAVIFYLYALPLQTCGLASEFEVYTSSWPHVAHDDIPVG